MPMAVPVRSGGSSSSSSSSSSCCSSSNSNSSHARTLVIIGHNADLTSSSAVTTTTTTTTTTTSIGEWRAAVSVLETALWGRKKTELPSAIVYTAAIHACGRAREWRPAITILHQMLNSG